VACDYVNLEPVGEALQKKYPAAMLIFCADGARSQPRRGLPQGRRGSLLLAMEARILTPTMTPASM
jgi:phage/plasmid primase-like uncharacterized protein